MTRTDLTDDAIKILKEDPLLKATLAKKSKLSVDTINRYIRNAARELVHPDMVEIMADYLKVESSTLTVEVVITEPHEKE